MRRVNFLVIIVLAILLITGCKNGDTAAPVVTDPITGETITTVPNEDNNDSEKGTDSDKEPDKEPDKETDNDTDKTPDKETEKETDKEAEKDPNKDNEKVDPTIPSGSVLNIDKDVLPYTEEQIYKQLFDINNKIEVDVDITKDELQKIQDDYNKYRDMGSKSPIYREADLLITITTAKDKYTYKIEDIGIRMKGNTSRNDFYNSNDGIYNLIHFKVDFQETFEDKDYYGNAAKDWSNDSVGKKARKDRTFATLEKLEFKWNRNDDCTYIREYYTYEFYRANGVLAPRTNLSSFDIAGIHEGVFMMYEPIDKIFIEKNVAKADQGGDLYKCGWTWNGAGFFTDCSIGIENEDTGEFYNYDLKTNKKTSDHEALNNLIKTMNGKVTKEQIAQLIDIDNFLLFEAASYFTGNPDDVRNNYNNYYIYFLKSSGKMIFIPYDMDRCFGVTNTWNPTGNALTEVSPFSQSMAGSGQQQGNPIYVKTVDEGGFYVAEFAEVLKEVSASKWLTTENFNKYYNIAYNNYKNDTKPAKTFYNCEGHKFTFNNNGIDGNWTFANYISAKLATYKKYAAKVDDYTSTVQPYYIRGAFTDWGLNTDYRMTYNKANNTYTFTLKLNEKAGWKINNGVDGDVGEWYGYADVKSITSGIDMTASEGHGNVILPAGTYLITFYMSDMMMTIEAK